MIHVSKVVSYHATGAKAALRKDPPVVYYVAVLGACGDDTCQLPAVVGKFTSPEAGRFVPGALVYGQQVQPFLPGTTVAQDNVSHTPTKVDGAWKASRFGENFDLHELRPHPDNQSDVKSDLPNQIMLVGVIKGEDASEPRGVCMQIVVGPDGGRFYQSAPHNFVLITCHYNICCATQSHMLTTQA